MRLKTCKACKSKFEPTRPLQTCCDIPCAIVHANNLKAKNARKEHKIAKERIKSRGDYAREAQIAFNSWVRARDQGKPCISCGSFTGKQNAGHYRSVGCSPSTRFEPLNCHLQCEKCNSYLSGNLINYRINLIKTGKITHEQLEWLEGHHEPKHYSIDDLKEIKAKYTKLARELKNAIQ